MKTKDMSCFNLRLVFPYLINIYKIFKVEILAWEWDPYNIMGDLSWMKVGGLLLLFLAFSFSSIEALLIPLKNPRFVRLCLSGQHFSISMALSLLASLIFPQEIFWVINPLIILLSFCSPPRILNLLICLHAAASRLPGCSILITATSLQTQLVAASQVINEGRYPVEEGSGAGAGSEESEEDRDLEANDMGGSPSCDDQLKINMCIYILKKVLLPLNGELNNSGYVAPYVIHIEQHNQTYFVDD